MRSPFYLVIVLVSLPGIAWSDSMRCGQALVNETASVAELLSKCGEPTSKDVKQEDTFAKNANGTTRKIGTQTTERWRYDRGSRAFAMVVTIVDDKIRSLERAE